MYIDSFASWLDTRAKYVLMADKTRHQIDRRSGCRPATGDQQLQLGDEFIWTNDPRVDFADLTRRYHEYVDTHTLANFLVAQGGHEFLWRRTVRKVDTWTAADGVWLQVVFADNGECCRMNSTEVYRRAVAGYGLEKDFIGFYLSSLESVARSTVHPHDFTQLILKDPFLNQVLIHITPTMFRNVLVATGQNWSIWQWQHPVITTTYQYQLRRTLEVPGYPVQLIWSGFRND